MSAQIHMVGSVYSFLQRGVEWSEDLVEVSWLGINGGLGLRPGSVGSSSEPRSPEPPCCIAVRPTIGQVEQPGGGTTNNQTVAFLHM